MKIMRVFQDWSMQKVLVEIDLDGLSNTEIMQEHRHQVSEGNYPVVTLG